MLYKQKDTPKLSMDLFRAPTSEYRGAPFWAWNCKLKKEELEWQLEVLKQMGFGGAHMHVRTGMATPYLSDEYMGLIKACVDKAKSEKMLAWLYDEDRWPSGAAGGLVTKDPQYRARHLLFTPTPYNGSATSVEISTAAMGRAENGKLLARYDVKLNESGYLISGRKMEDGEEATENTWYAYLEYATPSGWYNNQTYVNTLDKKAMDRFIEITYEAYNRTVADEFDKTIPAMFTDEPQFTRKSTLHFGLEKADVSLPWTDDLPETYAATYEGENIMDAIPELIWDKADGEPSVCRYHYHDHICERFTEAFADNCGAWCREHGISLTGHMMEEPTLLSQTAALGEAMRAYRSFDLPGIDMLCARFEYTTAKQAQSAVHQFGYEGLMSELYGVTNWDFDFRGHKLHGDWQAALGVTVRVPHLSWVSMEGTAKRDYPASISYQSPWWKEYDYVENHFARLATAMTRGKPVVKVGMIHPVESYWLHWGPAEQTAMARETLDDSFQNVTKWLLQGSIDFDYISESLLPEQCCKGGAPLQVGKMDYDIILVPNCETIRSTTLDRLEAFAKAGGKLVFVGEIPHLVDAVASDRCKKLAAISSCVSLSQGAVLEAVESARIVELRDQTGKLTNNLLHQLREDGDGRWLFIAHGAEPYNKDISKFQDLRIRVAGNWIPTVYNTLNGETESIAYTQSNGYTDISCRFYDYDSLLLYLAPGTAAMVAESSVSKAGSKVKIPATVPYTLSEPNALLLDKAEFALDNGDWQAEEEVLRIDNLCREMLQWPDRKGHMAQPWVVPEEPITHYVTLRYQINSTIEYTGALLAIENAENVKLTLNGEPVESVVTGWYADKAIKTVALPRLKAGVNTLEAVLPFGKRSGLEWAYLLGDFGVEAHGCSTCVVPARKELAFGDFTSQGLPFYGGNVTYHIPVSTQAGQLELRSSWYRGSLQKVQLDDAERIPVVYPPYTVDLGQVDAGEHTLHLTLFGHRRNGFGPVHLTDMARQWIGPDAWYSVDDAWAYDYSIAPEGVLSTPVVTLK